MQRSSTVVLDQPSANESIYHNDFPAFTPILSDCVHFLDTLPASRCVAAGDLVIEQGRIADAVHLVESGLVKLVHDSACGREITIGLRTKGWYAGYTSAFLSAPSAYSARAVTACRVVRIPTAEFLQCLTRNSAMLDHFLAVVCFEVAAQASLQVEVMSSSAEDRLDHFMRERKANHPSRKTFDPLPVLKQMELAQLLAVTPEHLSRMMKKRNDPARVTGKAADRGIFS